MVVDYGGGLTIDWTPGEWDRLCCVREKEYTDDMEYSHVFRKNSSTIPYVATPTTPVRMVHDWRKDLRLGDSSLRRLFLNIKEVE